MSVNSVTSQFNKILRRYRMTAAQYSVLNAVYLRGGVSDISQIADFVRRIHEQALGVEADVAACFDHGWLRVLTPDDCLRDQRRWSNDFEQYVGEFPYRVGAVDFTKLGADIYDSISSSYRESMGERKYDGVGYAWRVKGQIRVFGAHSDEVLNAANHVLAGDDEAPLGDIATCEHERAIFREVLGPEVIHNWWFTRFINLPIGYRAIATYDIVQSEGQDE